MNFERFLLGSLGQLGQGMARVLRAKFGRENVLMSDIVKPPRRFWHQHGERSSRELLKTYFSSAPYTYLDILNANALSETVVNNKIDWLIHFSAVLSAVGEANVPLALRVNIDGLHNIMEVSK